MKINGILIKKLQNLTYKVKILDANKCESDQKPENMLGDDYGKSYSFSARRLAHQENIEDKVRDEVCRGINLLRKSRGGKISKDEKKFVKSLHHYLFTFYDVFVGYLD